MSNISEQLGAHIAKHGQYHGYKIGSSHWNGIGQMTDYTNQSPKPTANADKTSIANLLVVRLDDSFGLIRSDTMAVVAQGLTKEKAMERSRNSGERRE